MVFLALQFGLSFGLATGASAADAFGLFNLFIDFFLGLDLTFLLQLFHSIIEF